MRMSVEGEGMEISQRDGRAGRNIRSQHLGGAHGFRCANPVDPCTNRSFNATREHNQYVYSQLPFELLTYVIEGESLRLWGNATSPTFQAHLVECLVFV